MAAKMPSPQRRAQARDKTVQRARRRNCAGCRSPLTGPIGAAAIRSHHHPGEDEIEIGHCGSKVSTKRRQGRAPCAVLYHRRKACMTNLLCRIAGHWAVPLVFMPSNGVQPQREAIHLLSMVRVRPISTMVKSASYLLGQYTLGGDAENPLRSGGGQVDEPVRASDCPC